MAELKPYDPNKPFITFNLPTREEVIAATLGLIPGYRALKNMYENPEGPISETLDLAAEDLVPLYGSLIKPAIKGEDIDTEQALKEAAIFGIPMPYTKFPKGHPRAGEPIPNNLKEGFGHRSWNGVKYSWSHNRSPRLLYTEEALPNKSVPREGLATTNRIGRTHNVVPGEEVFGPHKNTNTGANIYNTGRQMHGTNRKPTRGGKNYTGELAWQGEMYPPGRRLRNDEMYGPYQWEDKYSRKLDDAIDANEYKWEYLINKTRPATTTKGPGQVVVPKQDIADIAMTQGRPDIAQRVLNDDKPRIPNNKDKRFASYNTVQFRSNFDNAKWKDLGNRQVEKELRETFASLPNDPEIRYRFAEHYGVPDLYQSWLNDPLPWEKMKAETKYRRYSREAANRTHDRYYERDIKR